jgi:hypothetical protein
MKFVGVFKVGSIIPTFYGIKVQNKCFQTMTGTISHGADVQSWTEPQTFVPVTNSKIVVTLLRPDL